MSDLQLKNNNQECNYDGRKFLKDQIEDEVFLLKLRRMHETIRNILINLYIMK